MNRTFKAHVMAIVWVSTVVGFAAWSPAQQIGTAPLSPQFTEQEAQIKRGEASLKTTDGYTLGLIPTPVDLSYFETQATRAKKLADTRTYPASFDLRTTGKMTPVKDQSIYGTCWAHAAYGSMESCLLPTEVSDFSENNLANLHGFDLGFNSGGNASMSMAYLARWAGPVLESEDPYPAPAGSPAGLPATKHVQNVMIIPGCLTPTGNEEIKRTLMDIGAIMASYYHNSSYYNVTYKSYYYSGSSVANHAVTIAGWDDNFDKTKFIPAAPAHGAYIVKNSWGTAWGDAGYFYVSYYDTRFAKNAMTVFMNAESTSLSSAIYQYDPLGWVTSLGAGSAALWAANVFTATSADPIQAVSFYANSLNTAYEIYLYAGVTANQPRSGVLAASQSGVCDYPGYRTIKLNTPAPVASGQKFSVVVKLTTPNYNYPQAVEMAYSGYSSKATASAGQSFYSLDGATWNDLTTYNASANFCLKAFGGSANQSPLIQSRSPADNMAFVKTGATQSFSVTATDPDRDALAYRWTLDDQPQSSQSAAWTYATTPNALGPHLVEVTVEDGHGGLASASWQVLVGEGDRNLLVYWPFDNSTGNDLSGWNRNLSITGSVDFIWNGVSDKAISIKPPQ
ncbi:MAG: lectin like domain-containing protein [Lentisphaerota bacterium]